MEKEQLQRIGYLLEIIADELYVARMDRERELPPRAFDTARQNLVDAIDRERQNLLI